MGGAPVRPCEGRRAPFGAGLALAALLLGAAWPAGCRESPPAPPAEPPGIVDAHVHLTGRGAVPELLGLLDRHGIRRAVVLSTPDAAAGRGGSGLSGYREGNEVVLQAAAAHPDRFLPFVALDLGRDPPAYLDELLRRGACGVKIYQGNQSFHERPLDDPAHRPLFELLERGSIPVLLHVNTVAYRPELERLLNAFPHLNAVCAHLCSSRTDLDRFESIRDAFPRLLFDTSHGSSKPAAEGFLHLERERDRFRRILEKTPERFLFGSDLVTDLALPTARAEWDMQVRANLGLLRAPTFSFWRPTGPGAALSPGEYRGLELPADLLRPILEDNAKRWLARCLSPR
jgi:predicted TIM-barrel fold metal-dependent hydrolase